MASAAQEVGVVLEHSWQVLGACFLLTFDEDLDVDRGGISERGERAEMHDHPRLVVGCPAPVETPVSFHRLERRRLPFFRGPRWLDVVMGIEENGRRTRRPFDFAEDGWMGTRVVEKLDVFAAGGDELVRDRFRRPSYL